MVKIEICFSVGPQIESLHFRRFSGCCAIIPDIVIDVAVVV